MWVVEDKHSSIPKAHVSTLPPAAESRLKQPAISPEQHTAPIFSAWETGSQILSNCLKLLGRLQQRTSWVTKVMRQRYLGTCSQCGQLGDCYSLLDLRICKLLTNRFLHILL